MDNAIIWLIRLLAAHLVTDFVLQPTSWVEARKAKKLKAPQYWYHIILTGLIAAWFTCFDTWWVPLVILISHGLIDWWKSYKPDTIKYFAIDQVLHLSIIVVVWYIKFNDSISLRQLFQTCLIDKKYWIIGLAVIFLTNPVGILIGKITEKYSSQITTNDGLQDAGKFIGILERLVIFFLVMQSQYEAIGLLVAAKSIIRIKNDDQKMSEYVLIGTLISISIAIATGFIVIKNI